MSTKGWTAREVKNVTWDITAVGPNGERVDVVVTLSGRSVVDAALRAATNRSKRATIGSGALIARVER